MRLSYKLLFSLVLIQTIIISSVSAITWTVPGTTNHTLLYNLNMDVAGHYGNWNNSNYNITADWFFGKINYSSIVNNPTMNLSGFINMSVTHLSNLTNDLNFTGFINSTYNASYVPYTGASQNVNLGSRTLTATSLVADSSSTYTLSKLISGFDAVDLLFSTDNSNWTFRSYGSQFAATSGKFSLFNNLKSKDLMFDFTGTSYNTFLINTGTGVTDITTTLTFNSPKLNTSQVCLSGSCIYNWSNITAQQNTHLTNFTNDLNFTGFINSTYNSTYAGRTHLSNFTNNLNFSGFINSTYNSSYVPYTGATGNVDLNIKNITGVSWYTGRVVNATRYRLNNGATSGTFLRGNGSDYIASTLIMPDTITDTYIPVATAANTIGSDAGLIYNDATDLLSIVDSVNITSGTAVTDGLTLKGRLDVLAINSTTAGVVGSQISLRSGAGFNSNADSYSNGGDILFYTGQGGNNSATYGEFAGNSGRFYIYGGNGGLLKNSDGMMLEGTGGDGGSFYFQGGTGGVLNSSGVDNGFNTKGGGGGIFDIQPGDGANMYDYSAQGGTGFARGGTGGAINIGKSGGYAKGGEAYSKTIAYGGTGSEFRAISGNGGGAISLQAGATLIGGNAGLYQFKSGSGGPTYTNLAGNHTAGDGGTFEFSSGNGGISTYGTNAWGGSGGNITFATGTGGVATSASSKNYGGSGGSMIFQTGKKAVGTTGNGTNGNFIFKAGYPGANPVIKIDNNYAVAGYLQLLLDNQKLQLGAGQDAYFQFTGSQLQIVSDNITSTDSLFFRGGTNGIFFNIGSSEVINVTRTETIIENNLLVKGNFSAKRPYWNGYDNSTQPFHDTGAVQVMNVSNNNDYDAYLIAVEGTQNITFKQIGDYLCIISPEFTNTAATATIAFWLQKTNSTGQFKDVAWSNSRYTIGNGEYLAPAIPFQFDIANITNDKVRIMWYSTSTNSQIVSIAAPTAPDRPGIPGVITNCQKVSEITE